MISVIVPVYNAEPFLDRVIAALLSQDYPADGFELARLLELPLRFLECGGDLPLLGAHQGRVQLALDGWRQTVQPILDDEIVRARPHGGDRVLFAARAGNHDEWQIGIEVADKAQRFVTAEAGHGVVGNDDVPVALDECRSQQRPAVNAGDLRRKPLLLKLTFDELGVVFRVFNDQDVNGPWHGKGPSLA